MTLIDSKYVINVSSQWYFLTNIRVLDFDPKSIDSVKKHQQRDVNVLKSVISVVEEEFQKNNL